MTKYLHLLRDPDVCGDDGQLICDHCKLEGGEDLEPWENFLNGEWLSTFPDRVGYFPVIIANGDNIEIVHITERNRNGKLGLYRYWSIPIPTDSMKGPVDANI